MRGRWMVGFCSYAKRPLRPWHLVCFSPFTQTKSNENLEDNILNENWTLKTERKFNCLIRSISQTSSRSILTIVEHELHAQLTLPTWSHFFRTELAGCCPAITVSHLLSSSTLRPCTPVCTDAQVANYYAFFPHAMHANCRWIKF